jgi:hypothetical protein
MASTSSWSSSDQSYSWFAIAQFHMSICPTRRDSSERMVCGPSSTVISMRLSSSAAGSRRAHAIISPTSQMWCSIIRVSRSMEVTFVRAGSRRLPGGWKCTPLGVSIWIRRGDARHCDGATA